MKSLPRILYFILLTVFIGVNSLSAIDEPRIKDCQATVKAWNEAHNNWHFDALNGLYADKVMFYCSTISKKECISYKTGLASPSKIFEQHVLSEIKVEEYGTGIYKCAFTKEVIIDDKKVEYPAYLILKENPEGLKIICESDEITDANLGFELKPEQFQPKTPDATPVAKTSTPSKLPLYSFGSAVLIVIIALAVRRRKNKQNG